MSPPPPPQSATEKSERDAPPCASPPQARHRVKSVVELQVSRLRPAVPNGSSPKASSSCVAAGGRRVGGGTAGGRCMGWKAPTSAARRRTASKWIRDETRLRVRCAAGPHRRLEGRAGRGASACSPRPARPRLGRRRRHPRLGRRRRPGATARAAVRAAAPRGAASSGRSHPRLLDPQLHERVDAERVLPARQLRRERVDGVERVFRRASR